MHRLFLLLLIVLGGTSLYAQYPMPYPTAVFVNAEGEEINDASKGVNAPLHATFMANPSDLGNYTARYEWKIYTPGNEQAPLVHRFDQDISYTFTQSGTFLVQLYATFISNGDTIMYPEEGEANPIMVNIHNSKLEMPNAFSPNGDGFNDIYKAKNGYQSIISFKATIFNRWGQKIYSWDSPTGGWDGKWNGKTVKDGVYYVVVEAYGADGHRYRIKKDINVLTSYENQNQPVTGN